MNRLEQISLLAKLGYTPYLPKDGYLHSSMEAVTADLQNKSTSPFIISIYNPTGAEVLKVWSNALSNVICDDDDMITFAPYIFKNDGNFIVSADQEDVEALVAFNNDNVFARPAVHQVDLREDLGDRIFIVSNAGILFSVYERPISKTIDFDNQKVNIFKDPERLRWKIEETLVGPYGGDTFMIEAIHVFLKKPFWN